MSPAPSQQGHNSGHPSPVRSGDTWSANESSISGNAEDGAQQQARRLMEEVHVLGARMRASRQQGQQVDRKAAAYANRLARHTARLLETMPTAVPSLPPIAGTAASSLRHHVLHLEQLTNPGRLRLLVVSSDGRLRLCTVLKSGSGARLWNDYDVADPPENLGLELVFDALSKIVVQLEVAVKQAETVVKERKQALDSMVEASERTLTEGGSSLGTRGDEGRLSGGDFLPDTSPDSSPESLEDDIFLTLDEALHKPD